MANLEPARILGDRAWLLLLPLPDTAPFTEPLGDVTADVVDWCCGSVW